jgi:hypothetical protein
MPSKKSTTTRCKSSQPNQPAPLVVVEVEESYWTPPTPEEWESLRWFQARIRAALARKYPPPAPEEEQSA